MRKMKVADLGTCLLVARSRAWLSRTLVNVNPTATPEGFSKIFWPRLESMFPNRGLCPLYSFTNYEIFPCRNSRAGGNSSDDEETGAGTARPTRFRGTGMTLGGDGVESRQIPNVDSNTSAPPRQLEGPTQERTLHIWSNGFSVEEGPLYRFDDPANQADLAMIRAGRAPLRLMNVRPDQRVNVKLEQHQEEWRQLPKKYVPFSGEGRRLGSPVPGDGSGFVPPAAAAASTAVASASATSGSAQAPSTGVDESQPTVMLRIQLPDGSRLPARFNTSQTIGDVYDFVQRSSTSLSARPWVLSTTFPNKDHTDKSLVLGDTPEFKRGAAAVVKWV